MEIGSKVLIRRIANTKILQLTYEVCPCAFVIRWRSDGTQKDSMQPKESNCTVGVRMFLLNRREWGSIVMDCLELTACYTTEKKKQNSIELKQK